MDTLFLQVTGYRIGGCKAGIVPDSLLIQVFRIGPDRLLLRSGNIPPGLGFVMAESLTNLAPGIKHTLLRQLLCPVSGFHTHIFLLRFVNFVVDGKGHFPDRTAQRIVPQLAVGLFLHFLKTDGGLALAGDFIESPLFDLYGFGGDLRLGSIQLVRCPVRTRNVLFQRRISAFLVAELQPGGRPLPGLAALTDGFGILLGGLSFPVTVMGMGSFFDRCFRKGYRVLLGSKMGFFLTAADAFHFAGSKIFYHSTVMGHFLSNLFRCLHFLQSDPPSFP